MAIGSFELWHLRGLVFEANSIEEGNQSLLTAYDEFPKEEADFFVVVIKDEYDYTMIAVPGRVYLHLLSTGKSLEEVRARDLPTWIDRDDLQDLSEVYDTHLENEVEARMRVNRRRSDTFDTTGKAVRGVLKAMKRL
ncbi:MAG: hypothetical protein F4X02_03560 [Chloroflexi bacterium]|nr:hypothetical protein [Chloroflexota bacterium]